MLASQGADVTVEVPRPGILKQEAPRILPDVATGSVVNLSPTNRLGEGNHMRINAKTRVGLVPACREGHLALAGLAQHLAHNAIPSHIVIATNLGHSRSLAARGGAINGQHPGEQGS